MAYDESSPNSEVRFGSFASFELQSDFELGHLTFGLEGSVCKAGGNPLPVEQE
jgi:hypothetical protein